MQRVLKKIIDTAALRHNWRQIRRRASARRLLAVVKSDAYGHGLAAVTQALADLADGFAVVRMQDAAALRAQGIDKPIILLQGVFSDDSAPLLAAHRLTPVIHSERQLAALAQLPADAALTVYLKINTGMNRLGFEPADAAAALAQLRQLPAAAEIILMTHFAEADRPGGLAEPLQRLAPLAAGGLPRSLGNSAASLLHGDIGDDWGRIGIALYGASPAPQWQSRDALGLLPAMTFCTELIACRTLAAGERIGYGGEYTAAEDMPVGIASAGYGDGYPRRDGLHVMINGTPAPVIGRVSMEMLAADLRRCPAKASDTVTLWGDAPSADDIAARAGMIAYELFTQAKGEVQVR